MQFFVRFCKWCVSAAFYLLYGL